MREHYDTHALVGEDQQLQQYDSALANPRGLKPAARFVCLFEKLVLRQP